MFFFFATFVVTKGREGLAMPPLVFVCNICCSIRKKGCDLIGNELNNILM
jgi:hypothetical protein